MTLSIFTALVLKYDVVVAEGHLQHIRCTWTDHGGSWLKPLHAECWAICISSIYLQFSLNENHRITPSTQTASQCSLALLMSRKMEPPPTSTNTHFLLSSTVKPNCVRSWSSLFSCSLRYFARCCPSCRTSWPEALSRHQLASLKWHGVLCQRCVSGANVPFLK